MTGRGRGRTLAWAGGLVAVAAVAGLIAYFVAVGLDDANKLAGVLGLFIALAGLALSAYGVVLARRAVPPPFRPADGTAGAQQVDGSSVGGDVTQIRNVTGVRSARRRSAPPPTGPVPEGQSVRDSQVGGDVTQVDGVGGDAEIER